MNRNEILFKCAFRGWVSTHIHAIGAWQAGIQETYAAKHLIEAGLEISYVEVMVKKLNLDYEHRPINWTKLRSAEKKHDIS